MRSARTLSCLIALLGVAACKVQTAPPAGNAASNAAGSDNAAGAAAPPAPIAVALPVAIKSNTPTLEFAYGWPAQAAAIPELAAWLRDNAQKQRADADRAARQDQASAKKDGYNFNPHAYDEKYAAVADTPRILVLQSEGYTYTGGAHGMPFNTVIIWDKAEKVRLPVATLLDVPLLAAAAKARFCKALDDQRAQKRGAPVNPRDANEIADFVSCVDMAKQTVLPISRRRKALDTVRVVIGPYEAGPYAEGSYTIELPMDAALMQAVKPAWKDAFTAG